MCDNNCEITLCLGILMGLLIGAGVYMLVEFNDSPDKFINQIAIKPQAQDINVIQHKWEMPTKENSLEAINLKCNEVSQNTLNQLEMQLRGSQIVSCDLTVNEDKVNVLYNNGRMLSKHQCNIFNFQTDNFYPLPPAGECFAINLVDSWEVNIFK